MFKTIILIGCTVMFGFWTEAGRDFYRFMFKKISNKKENYVNGKYR